MAKDKEICGHINRQFVNADGEQDQLVCDLPDGHEGDHQADYECLRPVDGSVKQAKAIADGKAVLELSGKIERGQWVPRRYVQVLERAFWGNSAEVPAAEVTPDLAQLAEIKAKKGNYLDEAQVKRNPGM